MLRVEGEGEGEARVRVEHSQRLGARYKLSGTRLIVYYPGVTTIQL